ncbi:hypothetical protein C9F78_004094 [Salmonella enterica subsp. enterica serovar 4,[5],12:b:-]|nr:hypothetical protein [Salmonella enterica subsp. enterica serovar 4,[5],12:b:-]
MKSGLLLLLLFVPVYLVYVLMVILALVHVGLLYLLYLLFSAKNRREPSPNAGGEERRKSPKGFKNIITVLA